MSSLDCLGRPLPERHVSDCKVNPKVNPVEWKVRAAVEFLVVLPGDVQDVDVLQECLRALRAGEYEEMKVEELWRAWRPAHHLARRDHTIALMPTCDLVRALATTEWFVGRESAEARIIRRELKRRKRERERVIAPKPAAKKRGHACPIGARKQAKAKRGRSVP